MRDEVRGPDSSLGGDRSIKLQLAVLVTVLAFATIWSGCGSFNSDSSNGNGGSAGGSSGEEGASCSGVSPCGGNMVGTWNATSSCLKVNGELDLTLPGTACPSAPVTGSLQMTGIWTANPDGTFSDNTVTSGDEEFTLDSSCLVISSTPTDCDGAASVIQTLGFSSLTCKSTKDGGCSCSGTVHQTGGLTLVSPAPSTSGNYSASNNLLTISGEVGDAKYSYCVAGKQLTISPQSSKPVVKGTVVFQKGGSSGSGTMNGSSGQGGSGGTGGSTGSGGTGGSTGSGGAGGATGGGGSAGAGSTAGPCDIYKNGGTPCVAAHSTVRALFGAFGGNLYQIRNAAGVTKDISAVAAGGVANAAVQDTFCSGTTCVITIIYDQSGHGNDLYYQGADSKVGGRDKPASATGESIKVGGNKVYSLFINPGNSYWIDGSKSGVPLGKDPEGMYMVTSGKHYNGGCCFDYGNSEADRKADGAGAMDSLNFSNTTAWGTGAGSGPWVMADLEYGLFAEGDTKKNLKSPAQTSMFVTAVLKNNGTTEFALKGSDATSGNLSTYYKGPLPGGWSPMKKQGAIVLGSGGDCCATNNNLSDGTFYEGCLVSGYPSDATEDAVQANIVGAGYGK
jgi:hypothetical protein